MLNPPGRRQFHRIAGVAPPRRQPCKIDRGRASSRDEAGETHRRGACGDHDDGGYERHASEGLLDGGAEAGGTDVLAHVYLLECVGDQMGHMMASRGRRICQPDDIGRGVPAARVIVSAGACLALLFCSFAAVAADRPTTRTVEAEGASIRVDFESTNFKHGVVPVVAWIRRSVAVVARYYGQFPASHLRIQVSVRDGSRVRHGTTYGTAVPSIRLQLGRDVTAEELRNDWVLVHEMVHLALPAVGEDHPWFTEGLSTYIEGIARVQAGDLPAERVWTEQVRSMPKGLPGPGDKGLDRTHTWGRTYWGGALFCLLADVEIRERTANRRSLDDALLGILAAGSDIAVSLPLERLLREGDQAIGLPGLREQGSRTC